MFPRKKIIIVGGGITGLSTAYFIQEKLKEGDIPADCLLIEADDRLGGKIHSVQTDDFIIEGGPDSFITQKKWGLELCRRLGLEDRLVQTNPLDKAIFVLTKGKLQPFPEGFNLMIPGKITPFLLTPLVSPLGKLRMGMDVFIPPKDSNDDESIADFVRRRLGNEAVRKFAEPILAGIFAGDAEKLSIKATFPQFTALEQKYGSLIMGMRARLGQGKNGGNAGSKKPAYSMFVTLRDGLSSIVTELRKRLDAVEILTGQGVTQVNPVKAGYEVFVGSERKQADALVVTCNTHVSAGWIEHWDLPLSKLLREIPYVSTATVSVGFKKSEVKHPLKGFGFVVPREENCGINASTWSSSKFAGRASKEHVLIRTFLGGAHGEGMISRDDEDLISMVRQDLKAILGIDARPTIAKVFRWIKANPQYHVGHLDRVAEIEKQVQQHTGFFLAGAAYRGVGIPDCVEQGQATAAKVIASITA